MILATHSPWGHTRANFLPRELLREIKYLVDLLNTFLDSVSHYAAKE
jgi:hypothetical protein